MPSYSTFKDNKIIQLFEDDSKFKLYCPICRDIETIQSSYVDINSNGCLNMHYTFRKPIDSDPLEDVYNKPFIKEFKCLSCNTHLSINFFYHKDKNQIIKTEQYPSLTDIMKDKYINHFNIGPKTKKKLERYDSTLCISYNIMSTNNFPESFLTLRRILESIIVNKEDNIDNIVRTEKSKDQNYYPSFEEKVQWLIENNKLPNNDISKIYYEINSKYIHYNKEDPLDKQSVYNNIFERIITVLDELE